MNNSILKHLTAVILFLFVGCSSYGNTVSYEPLTAPETHSEIKPFAELSIKAISEISSEWSIDSLRRNIDPLGFEGNEDLYQKLLDKVSDLGEFKKCEDAQFGKFKNLDVDGAIALSGKCEFENGKAKVTYVFMKFEGKLKIMSFLVNKF